ncbi:Vesicle transport v-SNARE 12 [Linum perenne]
MSNIFEGYERQYCELSANLSRKCNSASLLPDGDERREKVEEIKSGIEECDLFVRKMDLEARSLQPSAKAMLLAKLREYKSDLAKLKREFKGIASGNQAAHQELLDSGSANSNPVSAGQRERLAMSVDRLNQSSDRLHESRRTVLETEELGINILEDLHQQRQTLLHAHNKLHGVDDAIDKSKKVLTSMSRRISRNKWIVGSVIAALVHQTSSACVASSSFYYFSKLVVSSSFDFSAVRLPPQLETAVSPITNHILLRLLHCNNTTNKSTPITLVVYDSPFILKASENVKLMASSSKCKMKGQGVPFEPSRVRSVRPFLHKERYFQELRRWF